MENLKALQDELIYQKSVIEEKSGYVTVANTNPSPYEITAGIKTIPSSDLSQANATEADVAKGKTFFSGNSDLKTGTASINPAEIEALFVYTQGVKTYDENIYYVFPEDVTQVRKYLFYNNCNTVEITLHKDITKIEDYAFYATNFSFVGFRDLQNLTALGSYSFANSKCEGIDFANLPNSIQSMGLASFENVTSASLNYRFPDSLKSVGQNIFKKNKRTLVNNLDLSNYKMANLSSYCMQNLAFNCNFVGPETLQQINMYFNHGGCFRNIILPASIKMLYGNCFGASSTDAVSNYYLETVTFNGETIPTISGSVFANQNIENGFKIYVPDTVIEEYKAVTNLAPYLNCIHPMSEKE